MIPGAEHPPYVVQEVWVNYPKMVQPEKPQPETRAGIEEQRA
jgi:hypothetical protein